jgi:hypothetical protein
VVAALSWSYLEVTGPTTDGKGANPLLAAYSDLLNYRTRRPVMRLSEVVKGAQKREIGGDRPGRALGERKSEGERPIQAF